VKTCRCGHTQDVHFEGVCTAYHDGDVCDCIRFELKGKRAKRGKSKRQDVLDKWYRASIDAPIGFDSDGMTLGEVVGAEDGSLAVVVAGNESEQSYNARIHARAEELYRMGRCRRAKKNADRDLEIYHRHRVGKETTYALAISYGLTQSRIVGIVFDFETFILQAIRLEKAGMKVVPPGPGRGQSRPKWVLA
jgi:hypothetical protein